MSDVAKKRRPLDRTRVNLDEPWEVQYRRREYGCTEQQLKHAVTAVGDSAAKVSQYLRNKSTPPKGGTQRFQ